MNILSGKLKLVSVKKIWDRLKHNALTDLIFFKGRWFCTFREGTKHAFARKGEIRILVSDDGDTWESVAHLKEAGIDLRDPKLSETPDGRLMLLAGGTIAKNKKYVTRQPRVSFSDDGVNWSPFVSILKEHEWLWRVTWHQGKAYGVSYRPVDPLKDHYRDWDVSLFESSDGIHYRLITEWNIPSLPNETTLRFLSNGQMVALVRRERKRDNFNWIGVSSPPFKHWHWHETHVHLGGPNFLILNDESMLASGRLSMKIPYGNFQKTILAKMDLHDLYPAFVLPSGGRDSSYPGMVYREGELWVSYYSSHEENTAIYLARLKIEK